MTDNEIIEALERCGYHKECCYCNSVEECGSKRVLAANALSLINRQNAEIERLNKELETEKNQVIRLENQVGRLLSMNQAKLDTIHDLQEENNWYNETLNTTKAEAYKEFAERLCAITKAIPEMKAYSIRENDLDNLLKEMVGENDA